jgi:hypothetical protein
MEGQRRDPRLPIRGPAQVRFRSWSLYSYLYTLDISRGGMMLEMEEAPEIGSRLTVQLRPPNGPTVELEAVVRHAGPVTRPHLASSPDARPRFQVGVQFENLDNDRRAAIERTLAAHGAPAGTARSRTRAAR